MAGSAMRETEVFVKNIRLPAENLVLAISVLLQILFVSYTINNARDSNANRR
jgi:hypothetical protein